MQRKCLNSCAFFLTQRTGFSSRLPFMTGMGLQSIFPAGANFLHQKVEIVQTVLEGASEIRQLCFSVFSDSVQVWPIRREDIM